MTRILLAVALVLTVPSRCSTAVAQTISDRISRITYKALTSKLKEHGFD